MQTGRLVLLAATISIGLITALSIWGAGIPVLGFASIALPIGIPAWLWALGVGLAGGLLTWVVLLLINPILQWLWTTLCLPIARWILRDSLAQDHKTKEELENQNAQLEADLKTIEHRTNALNALNAQKITELTQKNNCLERSLKDLTPAPNASRTQTLRHAHNPHLTIQRTLSTPSDSQTSPDHSRWRAAPPSPLGAGAPPSPRPPHAPPST